MTTETLHGILKKHGRQLLKARPKAFTALLIKLCVGDYGAILPHPAGHVSAGGASGGTAVGGKGNQATTAEAIRALSGLLGENIQLPTSTTSVVELMPLYSDDRESLLTLLEGVEETSKGRQMPQKVSTTLLELYLHNYSVQKEKLISQHASPREMEITLQVPYEQNIMRILDGAHTTYDPAHALLLVHSFGFERGERFLLEKSQSVELVMQMLIEGNDSKEVFKVLRREGTKDPELFIQVSINMC